MGSSLELGNGSALDHGTPTRIAGLDAADHIAAGVGFTCATVAGRVACWGGNGFGALGDGTLVSRAAPTFVDGVHDVVEIATASRHACARSRDGSVACWGDNSLGQLGNGESDATPVPVSVAGLSTTRQIAAGFGFACGRSADARLFCWGDNAFGQLGSQSFDDASSAIRVAGLANVFSTSVGSTHGCAVLTNGTVACWGDNAHRQLGDATIGFRPSALAVPGVSDALDASAGGAHSCVLRRDGSVLCWGDTEYGQTGRGATTLCPRICARSVDCPTSRPATPCTEIPTRIAGISGATQVSAGGQHTCAVTAEGRVACWGRNSHGQLGDGTLTDHDAPFMVQELTDVVEVRAGRDTRCEYPNVYAPACVPSGNDHTCARRRDGTVWCWGANDRGQLGDGTTVDRSTPVQVIGVTAARALSVGGRHSCVTAMDGTLACWGDNSHAQLGDRVATARDRAAVVEGL